MSRDICIIHANCQGDLLQHLLACCPAFDAKFTVYKFTNYLRENIPQDFLQNCKLFLYQRLEASWGELASENLLALLPAATQSICIPNMFFNGYWPLWTNNTDTAFGDMLLEHLTAQKLSVQEIVHLYTRGNIFNKYDINALIQQSQQKELAKETYSPIKTLPIIQEFWQHEQLFSTINHPGARLLLHVADTLLDMLGLAPVPPAARHALQTRQENFELPIHPQIGAYFALPFATADRTYHVYGKHLTHLQYVAAYASFKRQTAPEIITDFIEYLCSIAATDTKK